MSSLRFSVDFPRTKSSLAAILCALLVFVSPSFGAVLCGDGPAHEVCFTATPTATRSGFQQETGPADDPRKFYSQDFFHPGGRHDPDSDLGARTGTAFRLSQTLRSADDRALHTQESLDLDAWIGQYIDSTQHDRPSARRGAGNFWQTEFSEAARRFADNRRRDHDEARHRHYDHHHHNHRHHNHRHRHHKKHPPYFPDDDMPVPTAVPLPASVGLLAAGSLLVGGFGLRRRGRSRPDAAPALSCTAPSTRI